jgi:hypothetical protein
MRIRAHFWECVSRKKKEKKKKKTCKRTQEIELVKVDPPRVVDVKDVKQPVGLGLGQVRPARDEAQKLHVVKGLVAPHVQRIEIPIINKQHTNNNSKPDPNTNT